MQRNEGEMYQTQVFIKYEGSSSHPRHPGPENLYLYLGIQLEAEIK